MFSILEYKCNNQSEGGDPQRIIGFPACVVGVDGIRLVGVVSGGGFHSAGGGGRGECTFLRYYGLFLKSC